MGFLKGVFVESGKKIWVGFLIKKVFVESERREEKIWMEFLKGVFVERESEKNTNLDGILKWCFCWKWNNTKTQLAKQIQIQIWMGFRVFVESERKDVKVILWDESESEIKSKQSKADYYRLQLIEPVQNLWD